MSDENRLQTEEDLWDVLSTPVTAESAPKSDPKPKARPVPKGEGRFARPEPAGSRAPEPAKAEPAPAKEGRRFDGFFFACMAGVAALSVAATLVVGSMLGGEKTPGPVGTTPGITEGDVMPDNVSELELENGALKLENAELRAQLELQKQQITNLQADLIDLTGSDQFLATAPTGSGEDAELLNEQVEAYDIFNQIKTAYADFDRAKLEELIPQMDKRLSYLSTDALNEYYLILEYVEMPSNG